MKTKVELSPMTIGVDNAVTEAMQTGVWGVRLSITNDENNSRYDFVLTQEEAHSLALKIQGSLNAMDDVKKLQGKFEPVNHTCSNKCKKIKE